MVLANGSVLVVGGEGGSNGIPIPTLEILPTPAGGNTTVFLDFLQVLYIYFCSAVITLMACFHSVRIRTIFILS